MCHKFYTSTATYKCRLLLLLLLWPPHKTLFVVIWRRGIILFCCPAFYSVAPIDVKICGVVTKQPWKMGQKSCRDCMWFLIPSRLFLAASRPTNKPPNWICQSNFMLCHDTVLTERFWYGANKKCVSYLVQYSIAIHHIPYSGVNCPTKMKWKDKSMTKLGLPINLHTLTRQSQLICGILFHDGYSFALDHAPIGLHDSRWS